MAIDIKAVSGLQFPIVTHTITPQYFGEILDLYIAHQPGRIDAVLEKRGFINKEAAKLMVLTDEVAIKHVLSVTAPHKLLEALVTAGITTNDLVRYGAKRSAPDSAAVVSFLRNCPPSAVHSLLELAGYTTARATPAPNSKGYMVSVSGGRAPVVVHHQHSTAESEADRLAKAQPNTTVTVLAIVDQRKATVEPAKYSITKS